MTTNRVPEKIDLTFNVLTATEANTLYSGSVTALADLGLNIIKEPTDPAVWRGFSTKWTISVPVSGSTVVTTLNTIRALYNNIQYTIRPALVASAITAGQTTTQAYIASLPEKDIIY